MKVVLVSQEYPPMVGGGETHLFHLAEGLAQRGCTVTVCTSHPPSGLDVSPYRSERVKVRYLEGLRRACRALECREALETLFCALQEEQGDIVHVFCYVPAMLLCWLRSALPENGKVCASLFETHIPNVSIFEDHDLWQNYPLERALQRNLYQQLASDLIICGSDMYRQWALDAGASEHSIKVIPFGVDISRFADVERVRDPTRTAQGLLDEFVFFVPARPVPRKRIEDAIQAFSNIVNDYTDVRLLLTYPEHMSDQVYMNMLQTMIHELDLERYVIWEKNVSADGMVELFAASDAVVFPSEYEGFGLALIEAMASRRPVITANVAGRQEAVSDGVTGYLYPPGDIHALAALMKRAKTHLEMQIVQQAFAQVAGKFTVTSMVDAHLAAYGKLLQ